MDSHDFDTCRYKDRSLEEEPCKSGMSVTECNSWEADREDVTE